MPTPGNRQRQASLLRGPSSGCMRCLRVLTSSSLPLVGCRPRLRYYGVVESLEQRLFLDFLKEQIQRLLLWMQLLVQCWLQPQHKHVAVSVRLTMFLKPREISIQTCLLMEWRLH